MANTQKIVEIYFDNGNLKFKGTVEQYKELDSIGAFSKPSGKKGASQKAVTEKTPKEQKIYQAFNKQTSLYLASSKASKGGNPNAILSVKFSDIPSAKNRQFLKAFGFRWNASNLTWDNANTEDNQKALEFLK